MTAIVELNELVQHLEDDKIRLLVEVAKGFSSYSEEYPEDLHYIDLAHEELRNGTHAKWEDIDWN
jgi:hypothetical protein